MAEIVAHADRATRPRARQEQIDTEFAKAAKVTGIEPRASRERTSTAGKRLTKAEAC
ncbi:hypothetical protein ACFVZT_32995 [Streptomyces sp. NPDC058321]|uniref:hypothetical protein n=1 Tax=Streptomyces sp. NPDC058321 TaxID=3346445 RepID=UPI0036F00249